MKWILVDCIIVAVVCVFMSLGAFYLGGVVLQLATFPVALYLGIRLGDLHRK